MKGKLGWWKIGNYEGRGSKRSFLLQVVLSIFLQKAHSIHFLASHLFSAPLQWGLCPVLPQNHPFPSHVWCPGRMLTRVYLGPYFIWFLFGVLVFVSFFYFFVIISYFENKCEIPINLSLLFSSEWVYIINWPLDSPHSWKVLPPGKDFFHFIFIPVIPHVH